jgi:hypothetical protein
MATGIGSFPHEDVGVACDLILNSIPEMPVWPQLSKIDYREQMEIQFGEGLPCIIFDETKRRAYFDTSGDPTSALETFYENYVAENLEHFRISPEFGRGIYEMKNKLNGTKPNSIKYFKSQVTGPITIGLGLVDENKRAIYYNEMFRDVIVKGIAMKARWLLEQFQNHEHQQICFIDEPILSAFGSSTYVSVQRSDVVGCLHEVIEAIQQDGSICGAHCCGNTEWPILIDAGVDIISFDAYDFGETISYYPKQIKAFLENGGTIAWGIVPTSAKIHDETPEFLIEKLTDLVHKLAGKGIDEELIWERCLLTPSCGTGSYSVEISEKVFYQLSEVSRRIHESNSIPLDPHPTQ